MEQINRQENQITQGVIWKSMLAFFFPILVGTFFQQLYNTVDALVVGRFVGTEALAAVGGSAAQITNLIISFFSGVAGGATVIVAQFYGAGDQEQVSQAVHTALVFAFVGGLLMGAIGIAAAPALLRWMSTPEETVHDATVYLRIVFLSMAPSMVYNIGSGILRAIGDSKRPLYYLMICCIINIVLDLVFVLWLKMGVAGVAVATSIAQVTSAALVILSLLRTRESYRLEIRKLGVQKELLKRTVAIGIPSGLQAIMYALSNMIITASINTLGTATVAAWVTLGKVDSLYWLLISALGMTMATFAGQNYGAHLYDRVKKSLRVCMAMSLGMAWTFGALMLLLGKYMFGFFSDDAEVIELAIRMSWFFASFYWMFVPIEMIAGTMRGMGSTLVSTIITALGICGLRVAWMLGVVPHWHTVEAICISYPVSWLITMTVFIIYYLAFGRKRLRE